MTPSTLPASRPRASRLLAVVLGLLLALTLAPAAQAAEPRHLTGTTASGASWVGDIPAQWNGTTILYAHGYGPLVATNAPDPATRTALLDRGYALVGSSFSGPSWWALGSAVDDSHDALAALTAETGEPERVIVWGTSMGGLVSSMLAEDTRGDIDGVLSTCGITAGALNLGQYQLNGQYALTELLAPGEDITLVNFADQAEAAATATRLVQLVREAMTTEEGRARVALAAALYNQATWTSGQAPPSPSDPEAQVRQQAEALTAYILMFTVTGRQQIELAAGGNTSATVGVDYNAVMRMSANLPTVQRLYAAAGLNLKRDLVTLTRNADITADPAAVARLRATSEPTGEVEVPVLMLHTLYDPLVPAENQMWYQRQVRANGDQTLLRRVNTLATGHCGFAPSQGLAALGVLEDRLDTGRWPSTSAAQLDKRARATGLPLEERFTSRDPGWLVGAARP